MNTSASHIQSGKRILEYLLETNEFQDRVEVFKLIINDIMDTPPSEQPAGMPE